jgi:hypothetical protein
VRAKKLKKTGKNVTTTQSYESEHAQKCLRYNGVGEIKGLFKDEN